jgi:hypothetical protein
MPLAVAWIVPQRLGPPRMSLMLYEAMEYLEKN